MFSIFLELLILRGKKVADVSGMIEEITYNQPCFTIDLNFSWNFWISFIQ
jgi:hypothetical protein